MIQLSEHFTYKKLLRFCLPSIAMILFTSVYGIVDGYFVSNFVGKTPFAAVNLIMPFLMILGCFGFMIGTGGSALVAKSLGEGRQKRANEYFTMMVYLTVILGLILSIIGILFMKPISYFLGATKDMIEYCVQYGIIMTIFNIAYMLQFLFQIFFSTAEKPHMGFIITITAGAANIVLDALFIAVFHWGVAGAALASGIGQCIGGVLPLIYFIRKNNSALQLTKTKLEWQAIVRASANGSSEMMTSISSSIVGMLYNFQLLKHMGENGIAAYGVVMYTQTIFFAVFLGYTVGTAPIVSYHYGAQNHNEMKSILKKSTFIMLISGLIMMISAQILSGPLSSIFVGYDVELFDITKHAFCIFSFSFVLAGFNMFASSFFTALNNGGISAMISFLRTLVFQSFFVLILPAMFGINGIWSAIIVAECLALLVSVAFLFAKRKQYHYI